MKRLVSLGLAVAAMAFGAVGAVSAQSDRAVERSGRTFHVQVCPGPSGPETARCHAHIVTDSLGKPIEAASPFVTPSGFGPSTLRAAYGITASGSSATVVAIVDAYGYPTAESDLAVYRAQYGLPACTTANGCFKKVNQSGVQGGYPRTDTGWSQEQALDLDMVSAMCPGCKILLVQAKSANFLDLAAAVDTAAKLGAVVISNSYGGSDSASLAPYEFHWNHSGVAVTVSTGDSGYGVQFPASSPHVIAVGGTHLTTNGTTFAETAWSGAGSGCSTVYAKPSFQTDTGCAKRTVADVSAVADPNTGVAVYAPITAKRSAWVVFGGTSVSAPIIGGISGVKGGGTYTAASLYANSAFFNDVISGSNGSCGGSYLCTAGSGYDGPTGLGTPVGTTAF